MSKMSSVLQMPHRAHSAKPADQCCPEAGLKCPTLTKQGEVAGQFITRVHQTVGLRCCVAAADGETPLQSLQETKFAVQCVRDQPRLLSGGESTDYHDSFAGDVRAVCLGYWSTVP